MKKIIFFFCLVFSLNTNAQILFQQDFEMGISPMTIVDGDMQIPHDDVAEYADAWTVANPASGNGTNIAVSNSWYSPAGIANDWMITPAIEITSDTFSLEWDAKAQDLNFPDGYKVLVSTSDTAIANFTTEIFSRTTESGSWIHRKVSLADFDGQTIHIAFQNNSDDKFLLYIDNITVRITPAIEGNLIASGDALKIINTPAETRGFDFKYTNTGAEEITNFDFVYSIDGANDVIVSSTEIIPAGASTTLTVDDLAVGEHQIIATISNVNGTGYNSNTVSFDVITEVPVPNYTGTDVNGNSYDLHQLLSEGKTVVLNFFTSSSASSETSAPILSEAWTNLGSGDNDFQALGFTVDADDDDSVISGLDWGIDYPAFSYTEDNEYFWSIFNFQFGNNGIPLYIMICPNANDPAFSSISWSTVGAGISAEEIENESVICLTTSTVNIAAAYGLKVYPNPVSERTTVEFNIPTAEKVSITILNTLGQIVSVKDLGYTTAGLHTEMIDLNRQTAGVYQILIQFGDKVASSKVTVIK